MSIQGCANVISCFPGVRWLREGLGSCCAAFGDIGTKAAKFRREQPECSELTVPCMGQRRLCIPLREGDVLTWRYVSTGDHELRMEQQFTEIRSRSFSSSQSPGRSNLRHAQSLNDLRLHPLQERRRERGTRLSATSKLARVSQGDDGGLELNVGTQKASPSSPRRHLSRQPPQSPSSFHRQMSAPSSISPGAGGKGPAPGSKRDSGDGSPDVGCSNASDVSLHEALNFAPSTNPPDAPSRSGCITAACDGALALVWHNEEGRRDEGILLAVHLNGEYLNAVGVGFGGR